MRTITTAQQGVIDAGNQAEFVRVSVKDSGGTFRDLTSYPGYNAVRQVTWGETIDNPHQTFTIDLIREMYGFSLSPFVAGSPVNIGFTPGGTFAPLIALNREVKIEVAIVPMGMQPLSGDWMEVLRGRIDTLDAASSTNVSIAGRGLSGRLAQQYIKRELVYSFAADGGAAVALLVWAPNMVVVAGDYVLPASRGNTDPGAPSGIPMFLKCTTGGTTGTTEPVWTTSSGQTDGSAVWNHIGSTTTAGNPVEEIMQNLLDNNKGSGDPSVTLYIPTSPSWGISQYLQGRTFTLDAVRTLAQQIGWDVRYKWRAGVGHDQFEFTFYQPDRTSPSVDHSFAPSEFLAPTQLAVDISTIRNYWDITYSDAADLWPDGTPKRKTRTVSDSTSITKYGELYAEIQEDSASQIDTQAEADTLIAAALSDCKEPNAVMGITLVRGFPWVELNDYDTFQAGGVVPHFDSDQSLAVTQYSHTISGGDKAQLKTTLGVRGLPTIGTGAWLGTIVHPKIPPRSFTPSTAHQKQAFSGVNTPTQDLNLAVGGTHGKINQTVDKNHLLPDYEVHIYPSSGATLDSSTLYAVTKSLSNSYIAGLVPGRTYYLKTIPRWFNGQRLVRGEPSSEQSFVAGQALAGHLSAEPDLTRLPLNGGFETQFDAGFPPDHWDEPSGTWGTDITLVTGSGGVTGGNYLSFADTATAKELDSDLFPIEAERLYSISAWENENFGGGAGNGTIELKWYDSSRSPISGSEVDLTNNPLIGGHWIHLKGAVVAPSNARFARVRIFQTSSGTAHGFLVDKIEVKRLSYCGVLTAYSSSLPNTTGTTYFAPGAANTLANELLTQIVGEVVLYGLTVTSRLGGGTIDYKVTVNVNNTATSITTTLASGALTGSDTTHVYTNSFQSGGAVPLVGVSFQLDATVLSGTPAHNQDVIVAVGIWQ